MGKVYNILSNEAFWQVNKRIAKISSVEASVLLADLVSKEKYFKDRGELTEDGFFFNSQKQIESDTTLTAKIQNSRLKQLEKHGLVEVALRKIPATKHYKINHENIVKILMYDSDLDSLSQKDNQDSTEEDNYLVPKVETTSSQTDKLDSTKGITNNKQSNNKQSNNKQVLVSINSNELIETSTEILEIGFVDLETQKEKEKEKSSVQKEKPLFQVVIDMHYEWFKQRNDGVNPQVNAVEAKGAKSLASYFKGIKSTKEEEYESEEAKIRALFGYVLNKWDTVEQFYQKQVKLSQIASNITNIINGFKNGKSNSNTATKLNNAETIKSGFSAIDSYYAKLKGGGETQ